jgi:glutamyl-tRNA(Gln) amidotransferase subunit D
MMYSARIKKILEQKKIKVGDRVKVTAARKSHEGMVMPRIELGDTDSLVIKLDNGYNVGIRGKFDITKLKGGTIKPLPKKKITQKPGLPKVSMLSTGGTIASRVEYKTGGVFPVMSADEILEAVPELLGLVKIVDLKQISQILSEDITAGDWKKIASSIAKELNSGIEGVVVTHGTDTMHYSTAAMAFMLRNLNKPVVFVGAQRSTDRGSADSAMNLICSSYVAGYSDIAEVGVCMHASLSDDFCLFNRGTKVRKMHTSRRDTFRPINELPLAKVWPGGKMEVINKNYKKKHGGEVSADTKFEEKVALIKTHPGADPAIIDFYIGKKYRGLLIEATGLGHVPTQQREKSRSWLPAIKRAIDAGAIVAFAPQTLYLMHELGVIYCEDMLPETAFVKLGWVLGHTAEPQDVKKMMLTNMAGEISRRIPPKAFLY